MDVLNSEPEDGTNIRNYLATFQKEIEGDDIEENESLIDQESDEDCVTGGLYGYMSPNELNGDIEIKEEPEDDGELFEHTYPRFKDDSEDEEKLFDKHPRRKGAEIIRLGSRNIDNTEKFEDDFLEPLKENSGVVSAVGEELHIDDKHTLEMVAQFAEQAVAKASKNSLISNTENGAPYQTVTIVPSDTNPGELSYVLFVSETGECLDKNVIEGSLPIFNLTDAAQLSEAFLSEQLNEGVKMRTIRLAPRKSSLATQQHACAYCSYSSPKRYLLSRHMKSHSDERPHKCGVCERGFKTVASLQNHVNTHTGTRPHSCKECDSCFTTSGELVRHVRYKHTHEKPHKCTECDYASVELSKLKRHMRCHTGERPYQCPHCTYASPDTYKLKRHLRIHTGEKPYECDICQTRFTQSNSLKAHKLIHSGNKPVFHCEYCPATCGRKTDLRIHMEKLHSSDKPHRCRRCGKVFLDRYSYKIHAKSHDGEKCFKCDLCNYASISQRHLETHMFIHTDQKPFHCDECDQSFRQKQLLKRHKNIYHDPNYIRPEPKEKNHVCTVCTKAFRHKGNLIRHFAIHDPDASATDKELAMRLGEPKKPGQDIDGEEDEEEMNEYDSVADDKESQQVVVFEVIQLPGANSMISEPQTITMLDGQTLLFNGNERQEFSVIQRADEISDLLGLSENISDSEVNDSMDLESSVQSNDNEILPQKGKSAKKSLKNSSYRKVNKINDRKNATVFKVSADKSVSELQNLSLSSLLDDKSVPGKEMQPNKEDQYQKDFENCFGFNEHDDLLVVSTSPVYETFESNIDPDIS
ncbi:transcriptional repressor CTCF [Parasteatoda tepidariorum]|uniref:transcriptional repressor CTCF n=1 Tax=Parasteatoda tepidariorum TaxID=114398 RepID=UPI00077FD0A9|nr:transcriptional repressor CTCF [Parasteatoda tepidariorum]XP_015926725.1 transcriptional repressor CTCF [Parasteatoda tepidariorum]XP_015926726.1 transcriptional repressor CTCF [Parasteatoda tepidariorum]